MATGEAEQGASGAGPGAGESASGQDPEPTATTRLAALEDDLRLLVLQVLEDKVKKSKSEEDKPAKHWWRDLTASGAAVIAAAFAALAAASVGYQSASASRDVATVTADATKTAAQTAADAAFELKLAELDGAVQEMDRKLTFEVVRALVEAKKPTTAEQVADLGDEVTRLAGVLEQTREMVARLSQSPTPTSSSGGGSRGVSAFLDFRSRLKMTVVPANRQMSCADAPIAIGMFDPAVECGTPPRLAVTSLDGRRVFWNVRHGKDNATCGCVAKL